MAGEAEELRKIRKRIEAMNPPSVGCGVFVGLWLFVASVLVLRGCFGVDALWAIREGKPPAAPQPAQLPAQPPAQPPATSADAPPPTADGMP